MLFKAFGLEIECGRWFGFVSLAGVGEAWIKLEATARSPKWLDYDVEGGNLHLYVGRVYAVFSSPSAAAMA